MAKRSTAVKSRAQTLDKIFAETVNQVRSVGFEGLRIEDLAKSCGVTRPLLNHYFPIDTKAAIRDFVTERVLLGFKNHIDQALKGQSDPEKIIRLYVLSHFEWAKSHPDQLSILIGFLSRCVCSNLEKATNSASVESGLIRIELLLHSRMANKRKIHFVARSFQILLTGALVSHCTEAEGVSSVNVQTLVLKNLDLLIEAHEHGSV